MAAAVSSCAGLLAAVVAAVVGSGSTALSAATLALRDALDAPVDGAEVAWLAPAPTASALGEMMTRPPRVKSDGSGRVELSELPRALLRIEHPDFAPWEGEIRGGALPRPLRLGIGERLSGRLTAPAQQILSGTVCAEWPGLAVEGFPAHRWRRCATLAEDGAFDLGGLPPPGAAVTLQVATRGFLPIDRQWVTGKPVGTFELEPGERIEGRVVGPAGAVAAAQVSAEGAVAVPSAADGGFAIAVPRLPAVLAIAADAFRQRDVVVDRERLARGPLVIEVVPGEQLVALVLGEAAEPIEELEVWAVRISPDGATSMDHRQVRAPGGELRFDLPEPGRYRFILRAPGFQRALLPPVEVPEHGQAAAGTVVLRRGGVFRGRLVDAVTGEPVAGAAIEAWPLGSQLLEAVLRRFIAHTTSGPDGSFVLGGLDSGAYELRLTRSGYAQTVVRGLATTKAATELGTLELHAGAVVKGTTTRRGREGSLGGVMFTLSDRELSSLLPIAEWTSDDLGQFVSPRVAPGRYRLEAKKGLKLLSQELDIPAGEPEIALDLSLGGIRLQGLVQREGTPVPGGTIQIRSRLDPGSKLGMLSVRRPDDPVGARFGGGELPQSAAVGPDGRWRLDDAPSGDLAVTYTGLDGSTFFWHRAVPAEAKETRLDLELDAPVLLGTVVEQGSGLGVEAEVAVVDPEGGLLGITTADARGEFRFTGLAPGRYGLFARAADFAQGSVTDAPHSADSPPVQLTLERRRQGRLTVQLERPDGAPVVWTMVHLLDESGRSVRSLPTNEEGVREFEELPAGRYTVVYRDSAGGTGASPPIAVGSRQEPSRFAAVLEPGALLELACASQCGGRRLLELSLSSPSGAPLTHFLSGIATTLTFSAEGRLTLGRLAPGRYRLAARVGAVAIERDLQVSGDEVTVELH